MHIPLKRFACVGFLALVASVSCLPGAEPFLEKVDLFEARNGGYYTYRIPGIVVTKEGTILAYCEARKDGRGDWVNIDVLLRRSTDGGKTWSEPTVMADGSILCLYERGGVNNVMWDTKYVTLARFNIEWLQETTADKRAPP